MGNCKSVWDQLWLFSSNKEQQTLFNDKKQFKVTEYNLFLSLKKQLV